MWYGWNEYALDSVSQAAVFALTVMVKFWLISMYWPSLSKNCMSWASWTVLVELPEGETLKEMNTFDRITTVKQETDACICAERHRKKKPTTARCSLLSVKEGPDVSSCNWETVGSTWKKTDFHNVIGMIYWWVSLWSKSKKVSHTVKHDMDLFPYYIQKCQSVLWLYENDFIRMLLMMVPPRICSVSSLWHCTVAFCCLKFLSDSSVCVELTRTDRVSLTGLLFSVQ